MEYATMDADTERWNESRQQPVSTLDKDYDDSQYETIHRDPRGDDILNQSNFYKRWIRRMQKSNPLWFAFAQNRMIQLSVHIASSLVRRWTCWQMNWKTETLRSFVEVLVWTSATAVAYGIHRDVLWAAQIGFSVGLVISICDEVFVAGAKSIYQSIQNDPDGAALLQQWGFDVPNSGNKGKSTPITSSSDVLVIKNVVFGALALEAVRHVYQASTQDIQHFALLSTAMGVAFILMGEIFCMWLPTRRLGLTVQSRWTNISENWQTHFKRSSIEVSCWLGCLMYVYITTASLGAAVVWSSLLGIGLCIAGGLDPLDSKQPSQMDSYSTYWSQWAGSGWMECASALLSITPN